MRLPDDTEVSNELWDEVIEHMKLRVNDKVPAVRTFAVRALSRFLSDSENSDIRELFVDKLPSEQNQVILLFQFRICICSFCCITTLYQNVSSWMHVLLLSPILRWWKRWWWNHFRMNPSRWVWCFKKPGRMMETWDRIKYANTY